MANRVARGLGLLCLATGAVACAQPDESASPPAVDIAAVTENGLTENGFVMNGFVMNGLTENGLILNGLAPGGVNADLLDDPLSRQFLQYVVSCALDDQQTLSFTAGGTAYTFPG